MNLQDVEQLRDRLLEQLGKQAQTARYFERYYDGDHIEFGVTSTKYRESFGGMLNAVRDNWMPIVVDAVGERLRVQGFRFGEDTQGDHDAWSIWQRAHLDSESELGHTTALTASRAAVLVAPGPDDREIITVEHPSQMVVATESGNRWKRIAALKSWRDDWTGDTRATLYLPDDVLRWRRASADGSNWEVLSTELNPLGEVPVVPLRNRPNLFDVCKSELDAVTSTQDQINKLVCDMLVASEFQAFRQRWATGVDIPLDPDTGQPVQPFAAAIDRLWMVPDEGAKFGEFGQVDLKGYVGAIENRVQSLASRSRTPAHYMLGQTGTFPSGESLKATETGLIAKVRSRQTHFGEAWEEVIRLAFKVRGDARASVTDAETIWADPESRTESEHVDAMVKRRALNVPLEQLWEDLGYSPTQISRFRQMLLDEAFTRAIAGGDLQQPVEPAGV